MCHISESRLSWTNPMDLMVAEGVGVYERGAREQWIREGFGIFRPKIFISVSDEI